MACKKHLGYWLLPLVLILGACTSYNTREFPPVEIPSGLKPPRENVSIREDTTQASIDRPFTIKGNQQGARTRSKRTTRSMLVFSHDPRVDQWIDKYTGKDRQMFERNLYAFDKIRPQMEKIFQENGVPRELVYLSLVESEGKANAVSPAGATGYWQFIRGTAMKYGLKVNKWIDERRNLEKSTKAAAVYLRHLHSLFNDWLLACAGYNAGEGRIQRLMKRYPYIRSFWDISGNMPIRRETLAYVPRFLAALTISENRDRYGFRQPRNNHLSRQYAVVKVRGFVYLDRLAQSIGTSPKLLSRLNPEFIRGCTPPGKGVYTIKVPRDKKDMAIAYLDRIHSKNKGIRFIVYMTRKGDTLYDISKRYHSTISHIALVNRIDPSDILPVGKELVVPVNSARRIKSNKASYMVREGDTIESISHMFGVSVVDIIRANHIGSPYFIIPGSSIRIPNVIALFRQRPRSKSITYRVRKGDTIWAISRHFDVSPDNIIRWNRLTSKATIYPGDKITIFIEQS